jgi:hypothetical protein
MYLQTQESFGHPLKKEPKRIFGHCWRIEIFDRSWFGRKAPFTLMAKEVFNVIQMKYPDFYPLL